MFWKVWVSCIKAISFIEISSRQTFSSTIILQKLETSMLQNIWLTPSLLHRQELLTMPHLKSGMKNLTISKAIYGAWVAFFMKWQCWDLPLELKLQISFSRRLWSEITRKFRVPTQSRFQASLPSWWHTVKKKDLASKNYSATPKWWIWSLSLKPKRKWTKGC